MPEITFDIPAIKTLYPKLNKYYGFTYDDISEELSQVYNNKMLHFTPEEKELADQCRSMGGGRIVPAEFALLTQEVIGIKVTENFSDTLKSLEELYHNYKIAESDNGAEVCYILSFMAAIFNRDLNYLLDNTEAGSAQEVYNKYAYKIRPDMLKLYIALCQKKRQISDKLKISIQGNSPTELENYERWFEEMLKNYLNQYLGVTSEREAKTELDTLYSEKRGKKANNFYINYIFTSIFLFVQDFIIQSEPNKVTIEQCKFLHSYFTSLNLIKPEDKNYNLNNLQSTIKSLISSNMNPLRSYKLTKQYRASSNNKDYNPY